MDIMNRRLAYGLIAGTVGATFLFIIKISVLTLGLTGGILYFLIFPLVMSTGLVLYKRSVQNKLSYWEGFQLAFITFIMMAINYIIINIVSEPDTLLLSYNTEMEVSITISVMLVVGCLSSLAVAFCFKGIANK